MKGNNEGRKDESKDRWKEGTKEYIGRLSKEESGKKKERKEGQEGKAEERKQKE